MEPSNILIVDDNETNRNLLKDMITALGHTPVLVENGTAALSNMEKQEVDLVLLDILMPGMDGYEVLDRIKNNNDLRHIPVIMISAIDEIKSVVRCIERGADDYLSKPFNPTLLKARINNCLEKKQLRDREEEYRHQIERHNLELEDRVQKQVQEITASLKEKELLLAEVYHRTRNNMNVICSLLSMQSKGTKDEKLLTILNDIDNRIRSMSLVHSKLYQSKDLSNINLNSYIKDLVHSLFSSYLVTPDKISLKFITDDVPLSIDHAIPCGLAINEIIVNSLKHAFPENRKGEITINLRLIADCGLQNTDSKSEMIELKIADNGIGMPKGFDIKNTDTLGLKLVFGLLEQQLDGKVDLNCENGVEFKITFKGRGYTKRV